MSQQQQQRRVLAKAATCGWRDCLLWRRARASTACAGLPCLLSPPAGSAQPCLLRAQRARRAPPSELLQRVKQKAAAAAASPESSTRCCRPARTCTYSLVAGSVVLTCTNISPFLCTCTCTHCDNNSDEQNHELEKCALATGVLSLGKMVPAKPACRHHPLVAVSTGETSRNGTYISQYGGPPVS